MRILGRTITRSVRMALPVAPGTAKVDLTGLAMPGAEDMRKGYHPQPRSTDLTEDEWIKVAHFFPNAPNRRTPVRAFLNATFYRLETKTPLREIPPDFPPWGSVHSFEDRVKRAGLWPEIIRLTGRSHLLERLGKMIKMSLRLSVDDWGPTPVKTEIIGKIHEDGSSRDPTPLEKEKADGHVRVFGIKHAIESADGSNPDSGNIGAMTLSAPIGTLSEDPGIYPSRGMYTTRDPEGNFVLHTSKDLDRAYMSDLNDVQFNELLRDRHAQALDAGAVYAKVHVHPEIRPHLGAIHAETEENPYWDMGKHRDEMPYRALHDALRENGFDAHADEVMHLLTTEDPSTRTPGFPPSSAYLAANVLGEEDPEKVRKVREKYSRTRFSLGTTRILGRTVRFALDPDRPIMSFEPEGKVNRILLNNSDTARRIASWNVLDKDSESLARTAALEAMRRGKHQIEYFHPGFPLSSYDEFHNTVYLIADPEGNVTAHHLATDIDLPLDTDNLDSVHALRSFAMNQYDPEGPGRLVRERDAKNAIDLHNKALQDNQVFGRYHVQEDFKPHLGAILQAHRDYLNEDDQSHWRPMELTEDEPQEDEAPKLIAKDFLLDEWHPAYEKIEGLFGSPDGSGGVPHTARYLDNLHGDYELEERSQQFSLTQKILGRTVRFAIADSGQASGMERNPLEKYDEFQAQIDKDSERFPHGENLHEQASPEARHTYESVLRDLHSHADKLESEHKDSDVEKVKAARLAHEPNFGSFENYHQIGEVAKVFADELPRNYHTLPSSQAQRVILKNLAEPWIMGTKQERARNVRNLAQSLEHQASVTPGGVDMINHLHQKDMISPSKAESEDDHNDAVVRLEYLHQHPHMKDDLDRASEIAPRWHSEVPPPLEIPLPDSDKLVKILSGSEKHSPARMIKLGIRNRNDAMPDDRLYGYLVHFRDKETGNHLTPGILRRRKIGKDKDELFVQTFFGKEDADSDIKDIAHSYAGGYRSHLYRQSGTPAEELPANMLGQKYPYVQQAFMLGLADSGNSRPYGHSAPYITDIDKHNDPEQMRREWTDIHGHLGQVLALRQHEVLDNHFVNTDQHPVLAGEKNFDLVEPILGKAFDQIDALPKKEVDKDDPFSVYDLHGMSERKDHHKIVENLVKEEFPSFLTKDEVEEFEDYLKRHGLDKDYHAIPDHYKWHQNTADATKREKVADMTGDAKEAPGSIYRSIAEEEKGHDIDYQYLPYNARSKAVEIKRREAIANQAPPAIKGLFEYAAGRGVSGYSNYPSVLGIIRGYTVNHPEAFSSPEMAYKALQDFAEQHDLRHALGDTINLGEPASHPEEPAFYVVTDMATILRNMKDAREIVAGYETGKQNLSLLGTKILGRTVRFAVSEEDDTEPSFKQEAHPMDATKELDALRNRTWDSYTDEERYPHGRGHHEKALDGDSWNINAFESALKHLKESDPDYPGYEEAFLSALDSVPGATERVMQRNDNIAAGTNSNDLPDTRGYLDEFSYLEKHPHVGKGMAPGGTHSHRYFPFMVRDWNEPQSILSFPLPDAERFRKHLMGNEKTRPAQMLKVGLAHGKTDAVPIEGSMVHFTDEKGKLAFPAIVQHVETSKDKNHLFVRPLHRWDEKDYPDKVTKSLVHAYNHPYLGGNYEMGAPLDNSPSVLFAGPALAQAHHAGQRDLRDWEGGIARYHPNDYGTSFPAAVPHTPDNWDLDRNEASGINGALRAALRSHGSILMAKHGFAQSIAPEDEKLRAKLVLAPLAEKVIESLKANPDKMPEQAATDVVRAEFPHRPNLDEKAELLAYLDRHDMPGAADPKHIQNFDNQSMKRWSPFEMQQNTDQSPRKAAKLAVLLENGDQDDISDYIKTVGTFDELKRFAQELIRRDNLFKKLPPDLADIYYKKGADDSYMDPDADLNSAEFKEAEDKYKAMYEWLDKNDIIGEGLPVPREIPEGTDGKELEMSRRLNHRFREEAIADTLKRIKDAVVKLSNERQLQRVNRGEIPDRDLKLSLGEQRILGRTVRLSVDMIPGGLADDKTDADFDPQTLDEGQKVEMEHTSDPDMAREIARDHLTEDPNYYKKLRLVEGGTRVLGRVMRFSIDWWGPTPIKYQHIGKAIKHDGLGDENRTAEDSGAGEDSRIGREAFFESSMIPTFGGVTTGINVPLRVPYFKGDESSYHLDRSAREGSPMAHLVHDRFGNVSLHHGEILDRLYDEDHDSYMNVIDEAHKQAVERGNLFSKHARHPEIEGLINGALGEWWDSHREGKRPDEQHILALADGLMEQGYQDHADSILLSNRLFGEVDSSSLNHLLKSDTPPSEDILMKRERMLHGDYDSQDDNEDIDQLSLNSKVLGRVVRLSHLPGEYEYSCVHVNAPPDMASQVLAYASQIPDCELADKGRCPNPHVTVLYGIHSQCPEEVADAIQGHGPVSMALGGVSVFHQDDHDVLKVDVLSPDLHCLSQGLRDRLEHSCQYPEYKPHVTIAYLKKGCADKYAGDMAFAGKCAIIDKVVFSPSSGDDSFINLDGCGTLRMSVGYTQVLGRRFFRPRAALSLESQRPVYDAYNQMIDNQFQDRIDQGHITKPEAVAAIEKSKGADWLGDMYKSLVNPRTGGLGEDEAEEAIDTFALHQILDETPEEERSLDEELRGRPHVAHVSDEDIDEKWSPSWRMVAMTNMMLKGILKKKKRQRHEGMESLDKSTEAVTPEIDLDSPVSAEDGQTATRAGLPIIGFEDVPEKPGEKMSPEEKERSLIRRLLSENPNMSISKLRHRILYNRRYWPSAESVYNHVQWLRENEPSLSVVPEPKNPLAPRSDRDIVAKILMPALQTKAKPPSLRSLSMRTKIPYSRLKTIYQDILLDHGIVPESTTTQAPFPKGKPGRPEQWSWDKMEKAIQRIRDRGEKVNMTTLRKVFTRAKAEDIAKDYQGMVRQGRIEPIPEMEAYLERAKKQMSLAGRKVLGRNMR